MSDLENLYSLLIKKNVFSNWSDEMTCRRDVEQESCSKFAFESRMNHVLPIERKSEWTINNEHFVMKSLVPGSAFIVVRGSECLSGLHLAVLELDL